MSSEANQDQEIYHIISGQQDGERIESRVLEEKIQEAVASGARSLKILAFGQHGIGGRLWKAGEEKVDVHVEGPPGQRLGSMGFANTTIEVHGPASDDTGWLNAGAEIIVHGHAGNGTATAMAQGVGRAVAGMDADDDLGTGIEPAGVVRGRTVDLDGGVGKPHRTQALARTALDVDVDFLVAGFPETAPDAVLPKGQNFQVALPAGHRLLEFFLQHAGFNALAILLAADDMVSFLILVGFTAHASILHCGAEPGPRRSQRV